MLALDFLGANRSIISVFKHLADIDDDKTFANKTIDAIVNKAWELTYPKVLKYVFLPYLIYSASFIGYLIFCFELETKIVDGK